MEHCLLAKHTAALIILNTDYYKIKIEMICHLLFVPSFCQNIYLPLDQIYPYLEIFFSLFQQLQGQLCVLKISKIFTPWTPLYPPPPHPPSVLLNSVISVILPSHVTTPSSSSSSSQFAQRHCSCQGFLGLPSDYFHHTALKSSPKELVLAGGRQTTDG